MGEHSLLLVDGAQHKRARKLLMPAFRPSAMQGYARSSPSSPRTRSRPGRRATEFRSLERMNALTLEVILRVVFGVADEERLVEAAAAGQRHRRREADRAARAGATRSCRSSVRGRRSSRSSEQLDALLYAEIAERRAATDLHERTDVLSQLLLVGESEGEEPLSDAELRDQLVTLLLAGHETTASGLAWALYELGRHPGLMRRAQQAAVEGDDDYLEAVMKESLRLHPIIPMVVRFLMKPATIGGVRLPAGVSRRPVDPAGPPGPRALPRARRVPPRALPRRQPGPQHLDPLRRWRPPLHRRRLLPHGGRRGAARGARDVRHRGGDGHDDEPRVRNITSVPDQGARIVVTPRS